MFRKKGDKLDIENLNEVIGLGKGILKILFVLFILVLIAVATYLLKEWKILTGIKTILFVLAPFFIGLVIAWLFDPVVTFLQKHKIPRVLGTIIVYLLLFGGIYLLISLMMPMLSRQINDFVSSIPSILKSLQDFIGNIFESLGETSDFDFSSIQVQITKTIEEVGMSLATRLPEMSINFLKSLVSGGATLVLGLMLGFYMLFDFGSLQKYIYLIAPKAWHPDIENLSTKLNTSLRSFVQGTFTIMVIVFIAQSIGLSLAGLKAPLLFGLFCAITNVIPFLGPYIGGAPAVIVGFSQGPLVGVLCLVTIVVVQLIESNILQPLVMGKAMKLHPVTILVGLLLFQHFFGIVGMIVATPVVASLKIFALFLNEKFHFLDILHAKEEEEASST